MQVIPYIVASPTIAEAARRANLAARTIHRWMNNDRCRDELDRVRSEAADLARCELNGLMLKSVQVLSECLEDSDPRVRLRAAQISLAVALRVSDTNEIQQSLTALEDALPLWAVRKGRRNWN